MYGSREVDRIGILSVAVLNDYGRGNQFREVVHGELSEDLLINVLHFFCMEMNEAKGIFELTEGGFDSPASGIETLELSGRERSEREIGNNGFKGLFRKSETNDTKRKLVEQ